MKYTFDGTALRADGVTVAIAVGGFDTAPILLRHARAGAALEGQGLGEGAWLAEAVATLSQAEADIAGQALPAKGLVSAVVAGATIATAGAAVRRCREHLRAALLLRPRDTGPVFTVILASRLGNPIRVVEAPTVEAACAMAVATAAVAAGGTARDFTVVAAFAGRQVDVRTTS